MITKTKSIRGFIKEAEVIVDIWFFAIPESLVAILKNTRFISINEILERGLGS